MGAKTAVIFTHPDTNIPSYALLAGDARRYRKKDIIESAMFCMIEYSTLREAIRSGAYFVDVTDHLALLEQCLCRQPRKPACDLLVEKYGSVVEITYNQDSIWFVDTDLTNDGCRPKFESLRKSDILRERFITPGKRRFDLVRGDIEMWEVINSLQLDLSTETKFKTVFRYVGD